MYFTHAIVVTTTLLALLFSGYAVGANQRAINYFESALNACDRGMYMKMPKSRGSLRVLKSLLKRYQYNLNTAVAIDNTVKASETEHYQGRFFVEETRFVQAYQVCENEFSDKVIQAETEVMQKVEERQSREKTQEAKRQALMKKKEAAKREVFLAINEYCASYLNNSKMPVASLYDNYQAAKQKALEIYPNIVKQVHQATLIDPNTGKEANLTKNIKDWFDYCDTIFVPQQEKAPNAIPPMSVPQTSMALIEPEGPLPPNQAITTQPATETTDDTSNTDSDSEAMDNETTEATADHESESVDNETTGEETEDDDYDQELIAEYQQLMTTTSEGRHQVLKDEGRLPDYVDDEEGDYKKAKNWQYETEEGNQCNTYSFNGDKLVNAKTQPGECPPF